MNRRVPFRSVSDRPAATALVLALFLAGAGAPAGSAPAGAETVLPPDPQAVVGNRVSFDGFVDENGRSFAERRAESKTAADLPWIVSPMYTRCPHTCSALTAALRRAVNLSGLRPDEYQVLSFSFDPDETTEGLRSFRDRLDIHQEWYTLRATDRGSLQRALDSLDFRTVRRGDGEFDHPNLLAVLTPDMELAGYVFGVNFSPDELARSVRRARGGISFFDRWRSSLFFFAVLGFTASGIVFLLLLSRRRRRHGAKRTEHPTST